MLELKLIHSAISTATKIRANKLHVESNFLTSSRAYQNRLIIPYSRTSKWHNFIYIRVAKILNYISSHPHNHELSLFLKGHASKP